MRRYKEMLAKGEKVDLAELEKQIAFRDKQDSEREIAPLKQADDAEFLDTSDMTIDEVAEHILKQYRRNKMLYSFLDVVLGILFKIFLRLEVHGAENIPKTGPLVIASNHLSLLDPPVIGVAAPRKVHFMAKRELFVPVLGYIYKTLGAFPVNRGGADRAAIKHGIEILQSGEVLVYSRKGRAAKPGSLANLSRAR